MKFLMGCLPQNYISFFMGQLMHLKLPQPLRYWSIRIFAQIYRIRIEDSEKNLQDYSSIGDFFIRKLKAGVRSASPEIILHPADSKLTQIGIIPKEGTLIQAKGKTYRLQDFLKDDSAVDSYSGGLYLVYYLCPTDYHRVHSVMDGEIKRVQHIPGRLWPVNHWSVSTVPDLFSVNERVIVDIETQYGVVKQVFVGATNVGKIEMSFDPRISTNDLGSQAPRNYSYSPSLKIRKFEELGYFKMGSTVVMIYPSEVLKIIDLEGLQKKIPHFVNVGGALSIK